jgi:hypothetical protein
MRTTTIASTLVVTLLQVLQLAWSLSSIQTKTYKYFAFGSNMDPATMESLRNLRPLSAQAGVLMDYKLVFNIPGIPLVEPSAASVRRQTNNVVHGVIYELTDADFARVGQSEGVPFSYQWEQCRVIPYVGDKGRAGEMTLTENVTTSVTCYTLVAASDRARRIEHIPPSPSYLRILQDAAAYWKMDRSYQIALAKVVAAENLLLGEGLSGRLLDVAKCINPSTASASRR